MEWEKLTHISTDDLNFVRKQYHLAAQNISVVGRSYLDRSENDENAVLHWVPGFWRMAGKWVSGQNKTFRSSISLKDFNIYLVDQRVNVLAKFPLHGKTHNQVMIWLEEQILSLGLFSKALNLEMPYRLEEFNNWAKEKFAEVDPELSIEFGKFYHNTYLLLNELKNLFPHASECSIWPHHFDESVTFTLKETGDPATNTMVSGGFSPGDQFYQQPYFYVNSWPFVDFEHVEKAKFGFAHTEEWVGNVLLASELVKATDQYERLYDFYSENLSHLSNFLLD